MSGVDGNDLEVLLAPYDASRKRFRSLAPAAGWELEEHAIEALGPAGERLTIDVAISPASSPRRTVVISSGLHGVEAPLGAATQNALLQAEPALATRYPDVRFVFMHALNPFGFAWLRRMNEDNVDLNRNFLLDGEEYRGSVEAYRQLEPLLNPAGPPRALDAFYLRAGLAVLRHGMAAVKQAVAGGQYDYPRGLFFGGSGPSATQRILREHLPRWVGDVPQAVHLDIHTGLGPWGTYKLLLDASMSPERQARMVEWFGADSVQPSRSDGVAYEARGAIGPWCEQVLGGIDYHQACAEFGTYGPLKVLAGLRKENQATHWADPKSAITMETRRRLLDLFSPPVKAWWAKTLPAAIELAHQAAVPSK